MSTVSCPRCQQIIKNAPTVHYLGLSVSVMSGVIEWIEPGELLPLRPTPTEFLYEIILGGSAGASVPALMRMVKGGGNAIYVHLTALRHWLKDNCLPLEIAAAGAMNHRRYSLVEIAASTGE